jgi:broad specificity phosphatase PhoE
MTTTVYLLRHGAYENPKKILHLRLPGFPLSASGRRRVARIAQFFQNKLIVAVYASRLTRAYQTAEIIAQKIHTNVITDRRLLDIRSPLQGKPLTFIDTVLHDFYSARYIRGGGETLEAVFKRMDQCLRAIAKKHSGKSVVVVSHGDPVMSVWIRYRGLPLPKIYPLGPWYVPMGSGFKIEFDAAGEPIRITKLPVNASKSK